MDINFVHKSNVKTSLKTKAQLCNEFFIDKINNMRNVFTNNNATPNKILSKLNERNINLFKLP